MISSVSGRPSILVLLWLVLSVGSASIATATPATFQPLHQTSLATAEVLLPRKG